MKNILLTLSFVTFLFSANAQSNSWALLNNNTSVSVNSLNLLDDGSFVVASNTADNNIILSRLSAAGAVMWAKKMQNLSNDYLVNDIMHQGDNIFLLVSRTPSTYVVWYEIIKFNSTGNILANIVLPDSSENYWAGVPRFVSLPNHNIVILRSRWDEMKMFCIDENLNPVWERVINPDPSESKNPSLGITLDAAGNIFICGKSDNRLVVTAVDANGQFLYGKRFDNAAVYLRAYQCVPVSDGMIMIGLVNDYSGGLTGNTTFVCKTDNTGNIVWIRNLEDANGYLYSFTVNDAISMANDHILFSGNSNTTNVVGELDNLGNVIWTNMGEGPAEFLTHTPVSLNGTTVMAKGYGSVYPYGAMETIVEAPLSSFASGSVCNYFQTTSISNVYNYDYVPFDMTSGNMTSNLFSVSTGTLSFTDCISEMQTVQVCVNTTGMNHLLFESDFTITPNPAVDILHFNVGSQLNSIKIFNSIGELVFSDNLKNNSVININISNYPAGIYMVAAEGNSISTSKKFVVQH